MIHGGDIYRNQVRLDFSINVNPFGLPQGVKTALLEAVEACSEYPDIRQEALKTAVSDMLGIQKEHILFGNGASELFMAVVHALKPKRTVIPIPSFYGYEYAAKACDSAISYYAMKKENAYGMDEGIMEILDESVDLLFLANPNNPVGGLLSKAFLKQLFEHCKKRGIYVVLDECFIDFCGQAVSALADCGEFPNVIFIRAFTKIFAIPGVRIGYLINHDETLLKRIEKQLPEWNLSTFAQNAGLACVREQEYITDTVTYIGQEGIFLSEELEKMGFEVYPHAANFILIYTELPLYKRLLEKGILIRDCSNFKGLGKGYYRIAIKRREENKQLLNTIGDLL